MLLALLCASCVSHPYWVKVAEPVALTSIGFVDAPCGNVHIQGCSSRITGRIELKKQMSKSLLECVLSHERHHLAGYDHDDRPTFATDCGDGTIHP